jgi:CBS domain-containing protein
LQRILETLQQPPQADTLLEVDVGQVLRREPVTAAPDMRIIDAAQLMTNENLSSLLLVEDGKLCGVVTDHDLRSRCLAQGMDSAAPVRSIMTAQLHTIDSHAQTADALLLMNQHNIHHLPVVDTGKLTGMISSTDLMRQQSSHSPQLIRRIHNARDVAELVTVSQQLPALQSQLVNANVPCYRIGQIISSLGDALTQRLIALAQDELGDAPIAYAWLAAGSLARQEMTVISDQDNALLLSDDYDETVHGNYFAKLAQFVCDGLAACGIAHCPGKIMATNPVWRQALQTWQVYFTRWLNSPDAQGVMLACNFFDLRVIAGEPALYEKLLPAAVDLAQHNQIFLAHLAANATRHPVPLGFFRQFVLIGGDEHHATLDLKHGGVTPITELARLFALAAGITCVNTYERLQQAGESAELSQTGATDLQDALKVINSLRLRHQMQLQVQGRPIDNFVDPQTLSQVERHSLKEAFTIIRDMHSMLAQRYQTERFFT